MIIPGKQRIGLVLTLLAVAAMLVAGGAWALFSGYGFVLLDAAGGAVSEARHLNDLFVLQNAAWLLGAILSIILSLSLALLYFSERRRNRNLAEIAAVLKAQAAGDWYRMPRVAEGESEKEVALAVAELAESVRASVQATAAQARDIDRAAGTGSESGPLGSKPESIAVDDFMRRSADHLKDLAKPKRLVIRVSVAKNLPPIHADRLNLRYVFDEFLRNAVSCASVGGAVAVRVKKDGKFLKFEVQDDGPGIRPEVQDQVFKKSYRPSKYGGARPNAPLPGLFVAKSLVEKLGGETGLSSVEGRGSIFHFTLPFAETAEPEKDGARPKRRIRGKAAVLGGSRRRSA